MKAIFQYLILLFTLGLPNFKNKSEIQTPGQYLEQRKQKKQTRRRKKRQQVKYKDHRKLQVHQRYQSSRCLDPRYSNQRKLRRMYLNL